MSPENHPLGLNYILVIDVLCVLISLVFYLDFLFLTELSFHKFSGFLLIFHHNFLLYKVSSLMYFMLNSTGSSLYITNKSHPVKLFFVHLEPTTLLEYHITNKKPLTFLSLK